MKGQVLLLVAMIMTSSCAMIVKNNRQQVKFKGGPEKGLTKIITPDGVFDIEQGSGAYLMTRSKSDIPVKVVCPDGTTKSGIIDTKFDWLAGGLGNWWTYFIGSAFDAMSDKAYDIDDLSLASYCSQNIQRDISLTENK